MISKKIYLDMLIGKVFKLLPMKEEYDSGSDNHLYDYLENLIANLQGSLWTYPSFSKNPSFLTVVNNVSSLASDRDMSFKRWKSLVLYSTNIISNMMEGMK